jgi:iron-sulfur cluster repair protein YtfE (RIC family)
MPDVIDLLNHDHREVEQLFAQFKQTRDPMVVEHVCMELTVHTTVEEEIVYPVLQELDDDLVEEAEHEHDEAKQLIEQIQARPEGDPGIADLMQQLEEAVQHHVQEEETEAWPKLREGAGDRLEDLGARVAERKEALQTGEAVPYEGSSPGGGSGDGATKQELYEEAKAAGIEGRSSMSKDELREALEQES